MAILNSTIINKLERSELYYANLIHKNIQQAQIGLSFDSNEQRIDRIYYLINSLRYRVNAEIFDDTTVTLYKRLQEEIPFDTDLLELDLNYIDISNPSNPENGIIIDIDKDLFIQNQSTIAQNANFWIAGKGTVNTAPTNPNDIVRLEELTSLLPVGDKNQLLFASTDSSNTYKVGDEVLSGQFIKTDDELTRALTRGGEAQEAIFNTWKRFSHGNTGFLTNNIPSIPLETNTWDYDEPTNVINSTLNTISGGGFISDEKYESYSQLVTLKSNDADNDWIGVVITFYEDPEDLVPNQAFGLDPNDFAWPIDVTSENIPNQHTLTVLRNRNNINNQYYIAYDFGKLTQKIIANGTNLSGLYKTTNNWSGAEVDIQVIRDGNNITTYSSQYSDAGGGKGPLSFILEVDLTSDPDLEKFIGKQSYGYFAMSQLNAQYRDVVFSENSNLIYDLRNGDTYVFGPAGYELDPTRSFFTTPGVRRILFNPYENNLLYVEPDHTIRLLSSSSSAINGLTEVDGVIKLGGDLTENTTIGVTNKSLLIRGEDDDYVTTINSQFSNGHGGVAPTIRLYVNNKVGINNGGALTLNQFGAILGGGGSYQININDLGILFQSTAGTWAKYDLDYSTLGQLDDLSIPDLGYVKSLISSSGGAFVDLSTNQSIGGNKTFTDDTTLSGNVTIGALSKNINLPRFASSGFLKVDALGYVQDGGFAPANDSNVVHQTGTENNIQGDKTFKGRLRAEGGFDFLGGQSSINLSGAITIDATTLNFSTTPLVETGSPLITDPGYIYAAKYDGVNYRVSRVPLNYFALHENTIDAMGDSMTANGNYVNALQSLLPAAHTIINMGISGNQAFNMNNRFSAVTNSGSKDTIIFGGVNDIASDRTAVEIEASLQSMYTKAKTAGKQVIAFTIPPFGTNAMYTSGREAIRVAVNTWIMTTAINVDKKIDVSVLLTDPLNSLNLDPLVDSGDGLHFNATGGSRIATNIMTNVTFTTDLTNTNLKISNNVSLQQSLGVFDTPNFRGVTANTINLNGIQTTGTPTATITAGAINNTALLINAALPTQINDLLQIQNSASTPYFQVGPGILSGSSVLTISPQPTNVIGITIQAPSGATADAIKFLDSSAATLFKVNATGFISVANGIGNSISSTNSQILFSTTGIQASHNVADANTAFDIQNTQITATGAILNLRSSSRSVATFTATGLGIGTSIPTGSLQVTKPTNGVGTISTTATGTTVTGVNTLFQNWFRVGQTITANGETRTISAIASNTSMTTDAWTNTNTNIAYTGTSANALLVNMNGVITATGQFNLTGNSIGTIDANISNSNAGTAADARVRVGNGTANLEMIMRGTGFTSNANNGFMNLTGTGSFGWLLNGTERLRMLTSGNLGLGVTAPTAYLHIKAGTATAGTPPIKLTTGVAGQTVRETGAINWDGSRMYLDNGTTNNTVAYLSDISGFATLAGTQTFTGINTFDQYLSLKSVGGVGTDATHGAIALFTGGGFNFVPHGGASFGGFTLQPTHASGPIILSLPPITGTLALKPIIYTVATLPASPTIGDKAYVSDATAPTYLGTLTGGGSVMCPVFYNGTAWVSC